MHFLQTAKWQLNPKSFNQLFANYPQKLHLSTLTPQLPTFQLNPCTCLEVMWQWWLLAVFPLPKSSARSQKLLSSSAIFFRPWIYLEPNTDFPIRVSLNTNRLLVSSPPWLQKPLKFPGTTICFMCEAQCGTSAQSRPHFATGWWAWHYLWYACCLFLSLFFFLKQENVSEYFPNALVNIKIPISVACDYENKAASKTIVRPDRRHTLVQKFLFFLPSYHPPPPNHDVAIVSLINI